LIHVIAGMFISDYIDALLAKGVFCFSGAEASEALGSGVIATRAALRRLRHKGEIAMPFRGSKSLMTLVFLMISHPC